MSNDPFPERVVARKLCQGNVKINSTIALGKLTRLGEFLHNDLGDAEVFLSFTREDSGADSIKGSASAAVNMHCQRCLEPISINVWSEIDIRVLDNETQTETIADPQEKLDVVVCNEGKLDLLAIVEDELILSLPIVATHDNEKCNDQLNKIQEQAGASASRNIKGLDALEQLKRDLHQGESDKSESD